MMVLIENLKDGRYLGVASQWGQRKEAYDFRTPAFAIDFCIMHRLRNVRIIVDTGDTANSISLVVQGVESTALQESQNRELPRAQTASKTDLNAARAETKEREKRFSTRRKRTPKTRNAESQIEREREVDDFPCVST